MDNFRLTLILGLSIIAGVLIVFLIVNIKPILTISGLAGQNPGSDNPYTWTKAICDKDNLCQDYIIECNGNKVLRITPTGSSVQFSEDWKDTRDSEQKNRLC